jgi:dTDP-4-amino-4,6-dideoxygalactose transaminase
VSGILLANTLGVGNPHVSDWDDLAADHGLPLVIDSAAGFGSWYDEERRVGTAGTCEIFSLHATKPFGIGEGGAVVSSDSALVEWLDRFQNFGFGPERDSTVLGLNAKLPEVSAAIGCLQLERLESRLADRRRTMAAYVENLQPFGLTALPNWQRAALGCAPFRVDSAERRDAILAALAAAGVQGRAYYNPPVHRQAWFAANTGSWVAADLSETEDLCACVLSLPIHDDMDPDDIARVIEAVGSCR